MKVKMKGLSAIVLSLCMISALPGSSSASASVRLHSAHSSADRHAATQTTESGRPVIESFRELSECSIKLSKHIAYDELMEMLPDFVYAYTVNNADRVHTANCC